MINKLNNQKGFYIGIGLMGGVLVGILLIILVLDCRSSFAYLLGYQF